MNYTYEDLENAFMAGINCPIAGATFEEFLQCHKQENKLPFHPMWKKPEKSEDDEMRSKLVLVYEVDPVTKIHTDKDFGYFCFDSNEWSVLGEFSLELYCWAEIPSPENFIKDKDWKTVLHKEFRP